MSGKLDGGAARAFLLYAVAALAIAMPLPLHFGHTVARAVRPDVWLNVWALAWTSEHLFSGWSALFDANIFFPHANTLAYSDHFVGEALLAAPVWWATGSAVLTYNVAWYAALILTGWGGYLWARAVLPDEPGAEAAALVAGAFCLFVPGKRTALSHLQVISLQGMTLALWALHRLLRRPDGRRAFLLAAMTTYAALSSWYTAAYAAFLLPSLGLAGVACEASARRRWRLALVGATALALAGLAMVPFAQPYRAVQEETQLRRPIDELVDTSLKPIDFAASWSWAHSGILPQGSGAGGYFPGFLAVVLTALGISTAFRKGAPWPLIYGFGAACFALLALGPRLEGAFGPMALPYALLYRYVPGVDALRNPYRAAFVATLLMAIPMAYGTQRLIMAARDRYAAAASRATASGWRRILLSDALVAVALASVHLVEAWPGPQQVAPLPPPPSGAYEWLGEQAEELPVLAWPLPALVDENARYQLWSIGGWSPLANGHSGLHPRELVALSDLSDDFPDPSFLAAVKENFPVARIVAHFGLAENGPEHRARAARSPQLREVWSSGDDAIYTLDNGAPAGWVRRRVRQASLGAQLEVVATAGADGCVLRAVVDGTIVGEAPVRGLSSPSADGTRRTRVGLAPTDVTNASHDLSTLQLFFVDAAGGAPAVRAAASSLGVPRAWIEINGWRQHEAAMVIVVLDGDTGAVRTWDRSPATDPEAPDLLRGALRSARPGDHVVLAVAEAPGQGLIQRLRLLLDAAGGATAPLAGDPPAAAFALHGRLAAPPGSADEIADPRNALLGSGDTPADCRSTPIVRFFTVR